MATDNRKKGKLNDEREAQLQLYEMTQLRLREVTDPITEREAGTTPLRTIGHSAHLQRLADKDVDPIDPSDLLSGLFEDNLNWGVAGRVRRRLH
jgi:hypothetical protein